MALLAEPRRRQKYSIDPRGLNWSKDEDKFGHKMLEKMGWTKGKGLGANEDGNPDHITVKHKSDTKGVGCTKKHADNWLAHQDDFNSLLSALSADHGPDTPDDSLTESASVQSLEEKAQQQKSRVHYKKFTKGKDLSRYGSSDLDSILGKRKSASAPVTPQIQSEANSDTEEQKEVASNPEEENVDKSGSLFGVTTVTNTTSIADYFAKKMAALKESRMKKDCGDSECAAPVIQTEDNNAFTIDAASVDHIDCVEEQPKKKKKSRKSKVNTCTEMGSECSTEKDSKCSEGSKTSKKFTNKYQDEETTCTEDVGQDTETTLESKQKRKNSKRYKRCKDTEDLSTVTCSHDRTDIYTHVEPGKKSKESKKRNLEETELSTAGDGEDTTTVADTGKKRKKNRIKRRTKNSEVDPELCGVSDVDPCDDKLADSKKTKKSKLEKREKTDNCIVPENCRLERQEVDQMSVGEDKSSKKSKKKRKPSIKDSDCADSSELLEDNADSQSSKVKKPKKSKNSTKVFVVSKESVSTVSKADQVQPNMELPKQETTKQKLKRKKKSKEKNERRRKRDLEKLEKCGNGLGFVGSNLDNIGGYGGGFVVKYPWADKK